MERFKEIIYPSIMNINNDTMNVTMTDNCNNTNLFINKL